MIHFSLTESVLPTVIQRNCQPGLQCQMLPRGAGIVAGSVLAREYDECTNRARAALRPKGDWLRFGKPCLAWRSRQVICFQPLDGFIL